MRDQELLRFEYSCFVLFKLFMFDELLDVRYGNLWTSTSSQHEQYVFQSIEYLFSTSLLHVRYENLWT